MIIKGKNYKIKFDNRALYNIEKELGMGILSLINDKEKMSSISTVSVFIWAGIGSEDITLDDVIDGIDFKNLNSIMEETTEAIKDAFDTGEEKKN